jgi:hypothetical protein
MLTTGLKDFVIKEAKTTCHNHEWFGKERRMWSILK